MSQKRTSHLWVRNSSRYPMEVVWPIAQAAYESASRNRNGSGPRIIIKLTNTKHCYCGRAYWTEWHRTEAKPGNPGCKQEWRRILCRIGPAKRFPVVSRYPKFSDMPEMTLADAREGLAYIIGHEMEHVFGAGGRKDGEIKACLAGFDAVEWYRKHRAEIDTKINQKLEQKLFKEADAQQREAKRRAEKNSPAAKLQKIDAALLKWRRKLKLAQGKVKKYERQQKRLLKLPAPAQMPELRMAAEGGQR